MKTEMRRQLARQPFEDKIRKVSQLIELSTVVKAQRVREVDEDAADIAGLAEARSKRLPSRPRSEYIRERQLPPTNQ